MDRISSLPQTITNEIFKFLPLEDVVRTSILSSEWRRKWRKNSYWVFDQRLEGTLDQRQGHTMESLISSMLLRHEGSLLKFVLETNRDATRFWVGLEDWMDFLSDHRIHELRLQFLPSNSHLISHHLFSFRELKDLHLTHCFVKLPSSFSCFPQLISLKLENVKLIGQTNIISKCPILKVLYLHFNFDIPCLEIKSPSLKSFLFSGHSPSFHFENTTSLEDLSVSLLQTGQQLPQRASDVISNLVQNGSSLKWLKLNWTFRQFLCEGELLPLDFSHLISIRSEVNFGSLVDLRFVRHLMKASPNLEGVNIRSWTFDRRGMNLAIKFLMDEGHTFIFGKLKFARIDIFGGSRSDMLFVKLILSAASQLIKLELGLSFRLAQGSEEGLIIREILQFQRASSEAIIVFT